jgi:Flp pilus assembly pilin Flp
MFRMPASLIFEEDAQSVAGYALLLAFILVVVVGTIRLLVHALP